MECAGEFVTGVILLFRTDLHSFLTCNLLTDSIDIKSFACLSLHNSFIQTCRSMFPLDIPNKCNVAIAAQILFVRIIIIIIIIIIKTHVAT